MEAISALINVYFISVAVGAGFGLSVVLVCKWLNWHPVEVKIINVQREE
jgi:hypothetical protein